MVQEGGMKDVGDTGSEKTNLESCTRHDGYASAKVKVNMRLLYEYNNLRACIVCISCIRIGE